MADRPPALVIGDENTVTDAVTRYRKAGATDLIVVPLNERSRTGIDDPVLVAGGEHARSCAVRHPPIGGFRNEHAQPASGRNH